MTHRDLVLTERDYDTLNDLVRSPSSRAYGPMADLRNELTRSTVVAPTQVGNRTVTMNSRVELKDLDTGEIETCTLVYPHHADMDEGKISVLAPLGAALLGAGVRRVIRITAPGGTRRLKIMRLLYQPEAAGDFHL